MIHTLFIGLAIFFCSYGEVRSSHIPVSGFGGDQVPYSSHSGREIYYDPPERPALVHKDHENEWHDVPLHHPTGHPSSSHLPTPHQTIHEHTVTIIDRDIDMQTQAQKVLHEIDTGDITDLRNGYNLYKQLVPLSRGARRTVQLILTMGANVVSAVGAYDPNDRKLMIAATILLNLDFILSEGVTWLAKTRDDRKKKIIDLSKGRGDTLGDSEV